MDLFRAFAGVAMAVFMMVAPHLGVPFLQALPDPLAGSAQDHGPGQTLAHIDVQVGDRVGLMTLDAQGNRSAVRVLWVELEGQKLDHGGRGQGQVKSLRFAAAGVGALALGNDTIPVKPGDEVVVEGFDGKWLYAPDGMVAEFRAEGTVAQAKLADRGLRSMGTDEQQVPDNWALAGGQLAGNVTVRAGRTAFVSTEAQNGDEATKQLRASGVRVNGERVAGTRWGEGALGDVSFTATGPATLHGSAGDTALQPGQRVDVQDFIGSYVVFFVGPDDARVALEGYAASVAVQPAGSLGPSLGANATGDQPPLAAFDASPRAPRTNEPVQFADHSVDPDGRVLKRSWRFGDGTGSEEANPAHAYDRTGTFTVTLTATDDHLLTGSAMRVVEVLDRPPLPAFTASPPRATTLDTVQFVDQSTDPDGRVVSWAWDFGDGATSTEQHPQHHYARIGAYNVTLTALDDSGTSAQATQLLRVVNLPPQAKFGWAPAAPHSSEAVQFTDQSTDPDGSVVAWAWSFGDGGVSSEQNPRHAFASKGPAKVTLTATDDQGASSTYDTVLNVLNQPPTADFRVAPDPPAEGSEAQFTDLSSDPDGRVVEWTWSFGDGSVSTQPSPAHTYSTGGDVSVSLTVKDDDGQRTTVAKQLHVNRKPVAAWTSDPAAPGTGQPVQFNDSSVDPDGRVVAWHWDFGDGNASDERNPVHAFLRGGSYRVALRATDDQGAAGTLARTLAVAGRPPRADFGWSPAGVSTADTVAFTDASADPDGTLTRWTWDFGDGAGAVGPTAQHRFAQPGSFGVTLSVTDDGGLTSNVTKIVKVDQAPVAAFTFSPAQPSTASAVQFLDGSADRDGTVAAWHWDFGDGNRSTERSPAHRFALPGAYAVRLDVTDDSGSAGSVTHAVSIAGQPPLAAFAVLTGSPRAGAPVQFQDQSAGPDAALVAWQWAFGDGSASGDRSPAHTFAAPGLYPVQLTVLDSAGKQGMAVRTLRVFASEPVLATLRVVHPDGTPVDLTRPGTLVELREQASGAVLGTPQRPLQAGPDGVAQGTLLAGEWAPGDTVLARVALPQRQVDQTAPLPLPAGGDLGTLVLDTPLAAAVQLLPGNASGARERWYADPTEPVRGFVVVTWSDGAPVRSAQAAVAFSYQELGLTKQRVDLSGLPGGRVAGETDDQGRLPFQVPFTLGLPGGPGSYLPGQYFLDARAAYAAASTRLYGAGASAVMTEDPAGLRSALL